MISTLAAKFDRKLAAVVAVDVVGYSRHMHLDEEWTHARYKADRSEVIDPSIAKHKGRIVKSTGDGFVAEFASAVEAAQCMVAVQAMLAVRNSRHSPNGRMEFRVGINLGDVIIEHDDIYGDGVNIAARLEAIAKPGGICISGKVYDEISGKIDLVCEDDGPQQLKNIEQAVRVYHVVLPTSPEVPSRPLKRPLTLPDRPSIAVLPFSNLSREPSQDYSADGITEDIITELSRYSELFVIARNSSFTYKGKAVDVRQVGRELGVRYVLEGTIRRSSDRVRISAQLIDALSGGHCWAERYDRDMQDIFAAQDEVVRTIVAVLAAQVNKAEAERNLLKPPARWQAYDYYMRVADEFDSFWSSLQVRDLHDISKLLKHALQIDPHYGRAYALLSAIHLTAWTNSLDDDYLNPFALTERMN